MRIAYIVTTASPIGGAQIHVRDLAAAAAAQGILGRIAGRSLRVPVVFTVHTWAFTPGVPPLHAAIYRQAERLVRPLASKIITVSEFDRRLGLAARIADEARLVTVRNGMPDVAPSLRADPGRTPVRMVMVARFGAQKDHPTLFRVLAGLLHYAWELDLIVDGPLMAETEALAAGLGLAGRVRFLGQRTDVDRLLADAQVSPLVSNWEGFPLSILEAMRSGLPVVASSVGGIDESVEDNWEGFPFSVLEWMRAGLQVVTSDAWRIGESVEARNRSAMPGCVSALPRAAPPARQEIR